MHELHPLPAVQRLCLHTQTMKVIEQVILDMVQTGIDFYKLPPDEQKILKRILSKSPNIKNSPFNFRRKRK